MLKNVALFVSTLALSLAACLALAADPAPDVQMKALSEEVIAALKKDKLELAGNPRKLAELVESKVLPHFDFQRMTRIAMGANWRRATPGQQEQLVAEFRTLLVRTYSGAVNSYRDQALEFRPLRMQPGDTDVTVHSELKQAGAQALAIDYVMAKEDAGWKVYDVTVGGVSLVTNYRDSFADIVRNRGVAGLIDSMDKKNHGNDASAISKT